MQLGILSSSMVHKSFFIGSKLNFNMPNDAMEASNFKSCLKNSLFSAFIDEKEDTRPTLIARAEESASAQSDSDILNSDFASVKDSEEKSPEV